jgi:hypothetical protein
VSELARAMIVKACREKRFRPRAVRIDSTVIEADVKYPTDADLASSGVAVLAREGRKLAKLIKEKKARVRDRSRAMGHKLRTITRTLRLLRQKRQHELPFQRETALLAGNSHCHTGRKCPRRPRPIPREVTNASGSGLRLLRLVTLEHVIDIALMRSSLGPGPDRASCVRKRRRVDR